MDKRFRHESVQDTDTIKEYLQALVDGMSNRKLVFQSGDERVELTPVGLLEFALKARAKGEDRRVTFTITWKEADPDQAAEKPGLAISSGEEC